MTDVGNGTESANAPVPEQNEAPVAVAEKLPLRDALEVAMLGTEKPKDEPKAEEKAEVQTPAEPVVVRDAAPPLDPPSEWSREEKEDFRSGTRKQQEAALRLHRSRNSVLENIKQEKAELEWAREIAKEVTPFLKTRGEKEPAHSQVLKAIKLVNELDEKPKQAVINILKAKGLPIPKELQEEASQNNSVPPHLQQELESIKSRLAKEDLAKAQAAHASKIALMGEHWKVFEAAKNAAGNPRFPDALKQGEDGMRFARSIGSLVDGESALSQEFIADAKARIPDLTYTRLIEEAYRYRGGKVDDSEAPRTQDTQKHVLKSSRAASSVPGRGGQSSSSGSVKKYSSIRAAAAAALADAREREGR